jgi:hypothetical protein
LKLKHLSTAGGLLLLSRVVVNKPLLQFVQFFAGMYFLTTKRRTSGEIAAFLLVAGASFPLLDGGFLLMKEFGRRDAGRVAPGVVVQKLSTTGEDGTHTIGGSRFSRPYPRRRSRFPWLKTADGFRYHDVLARMLLTGSKHAWVIEFRYPCEVPGGCYQRDFVSYDLWKQIQAGQPVNVRSAKGLNDSGRLDENPQWSTALAMAGMGSTLVLIAGFVSGRWTLRPRPRYVTAPAVVMSVKPIPAGDKIQ